MRVILGAKTNRFILPDYKVNTTRKLLEGLRSDLPVELVLPEYVDGGPFDVPEFLRTLNILVESGKLSRIYLDGYKSVIKSFFPCGLMLILAHKEIEIWDLPNGLDVRPYFLKLSNEEGSSILRNGRFSRESFYWFSSRSLQNGEYLFYSIFNSVRFNKAKEFSSNIFTIFHNPHIPQYKTENLPGLSKRENVLLGDFPKKESIVKDDNYYYVPIKGLSIITDGFSDVLKISKIYSRIEDILVILSELVRNSFSWGSIDNNRKKILKNFWVGIKVIGNKLYIHTQDFGLGIPLKYADGFYDKIYHSDDINIFEIALTDGKTSSFDITISGGYGLGKVISKIKKLGGSLEVLSGNVEYHLKNVNGEYISDIGCKPVGVEKSGTLFKIVIDL